MIVLGAGLFGVILGVLTARKQGGNAKDKAQYGAVFGTIFAVLGVFLSIAIERLSG